MESEDYYTILEVEKTANETEIKKAYRKMALRWHPDKNPDKKEMAEANFKRVSEAYEVLSDMDKRKIYDQFGKEGLLEAASGAGSSRNQSQGFRRQNFHFHFRDPLEVFREFFGGRDPFADFFSDFPGFGGGIFDDPFMLGGPSMFMGGHPRLQQRRVQSGQVRQRAHPYSRPQQQIIPAMGHQVSMGQPFMGLSLFNAPGFFDPMSMRLGSFDSMAGAMGGGANFSSTSVSTSFVNGKKVVTKRVMENGVETVTVEENGRVKSRTVNRTH